MSGADSLVAALEDSPSEFAPLAVEANLKMTVDGTPIAVSGSGDRLRVRVPSLAAGLSLLTGHRRVFRVVSRAAALVGLTAEVRVGDAIIALAGAEARPSRLARALSLGPVQIRPRGLLAAVLHIR